MCVCAYACMYVSARVCVVSTRMCERDRVCTHSLVQINLSSTRCACSLLLGTHTYYQNVKHESRRGGEGGRHGVGYEYAHDTRRHNTHTCKLYIPSKLMFVHTLTHILPARKPQGGERGE
jgi:hypothetical protein